MKLDDLLLNVLKQLSQMKLEGTEFDTTEKIIFPLYFDNKEKESNRMERNSKRVSEQELRQLFIFQFLKLYPEYSYSIETPTIYKYIFNKRFCDIKCCEDGRSANIDLCIHHNFSKKYDRCMNIEFKYGNVSEKQIGKDILKLIKEKSDGAFVVLLRNSDAGTFCNSGKRSGLLNKIHKSIKAFLDYWDNETKCIHIAIFSLEQNTLIYTTLTKNDLSSIDNISSGLNERIRIEDFENQTGWKYKSLLQKNAEK